MYSVSASFSSTSFVDAIFRGGQSTIVRDVHLMGKQPKINFFSDVTSAALDSGVAVAVLLIFFWYVDS